MNENLEEVMETENCDVCDIIETEDYTEVGDGSGKVIALVIGGLAGAAALGVAAYRKMKLYKEDTPKKKRKKLMWVEIEDDGNEADAVKIETEEVGEEETEK